VSAVKQQLRTKFLTDREEIEPPYKKSATMRLIELQEGGVIEDLIWTAPAKVLAKKWGVSQETISRWRKAFL
jgi:hypothetical protein